MRNKIYFASDFHLGIDGKLSSLEREKQIVRWLDSIKSDAEAIYLVGDVFDFWFEYKTVIPKGYARLFGKLAELRDLSINIYFFIGNHDMWMFRYFEDEFDIPIYRAPIQVELKGKKFLIGHGDGLGPGDHGYKFIKKVFSSRLCQWLFARIHPNFGVGLANYWSGRSRDTNGRTDHFLGPEKEWLVHYSEEYIESDYVDFLVFGHRHLPIDYMLKNKKSRYINLGDWMFYNSYAVFDGTDLKVQFFENDEGKIFS